MAERRSANIYINGKEIVNTMANIEAAVRKTRAEFKHLQEGTAEYEQKARELQRLNGVLTEHRQRIGGVQGAWQGILKQVKLFSPIAIAAVTARALYSGLQKLTERLAKLSDAYADVSKTTGMTIEQVKQLDKQLLKLNTRTSRDELLKLAKEAGKLGITGVENVRRFVEQADKINVSLGEDLGEGAIIQIGKLANIFKTDMERIGSAINEVGASSVASEQWQVDFLNRMAGIAETAQLSLPDLLGYGAALENLGQTAEVSGTAMTQLFLNLVKNTEEFGQMAGFAEGELSKLIGEQGTSAGLAAFLKKLQESSTSTADLATKLDKLGIDGVRAAGVLLTLSNNTGLVAEQQQIANKAFEQNTSLQAEFAKKNDTLQASLDRMAKRFDAIKTSLGGGWLADAVKGFADFIAPVKQTNELINEERLRLNMLVGAIVSTNTNNELRKQYIDEIKTSYPAFNEMVQGDYTNHTLLAAALKQTNQEYLNKIILQRAADKHAEAINDQADAYYNLDAATQRYQQRLVGLKGLGITQDANESNQSFLNRLNFLLKEGDYTRGEKSVISLVAADLEALIRVTNDYTKAEKEANAALDDQEALRQKLGDLIKPNPVTGGAAPVGDDGKPITPLSPLKDDAEQLDKRLKEVQRQLKLIKDEGDVSALEFSGDADKFKLENYLLAEQKNLRGEITHEYDMQMEAVDAYWQSMMEQIDKENEQLEIERQKIELQEQAIENYALMGLQIAHNAKTQAEATKQILSNLKAELKAIAAKAIANWISTQVLKNAALGPVGLALIGAASALGTSFLSNIFDGLVPQFAEGGFTDVTGAKDGRKHRATVDQRFSGGFVDRKMLVGERGNEYVVPDWVLQTPYAMQQVENLEAIRTGQQPVVNNSTINNYTNNSGTDAETKQLLKMVLEYLKKRPLAIIADQTLLDIQERLDQLERLKNKSNR